MERTRSHTLVVATAVRCAANHTKASAVQACQSNPNAVQASLVVRCAAHHAVVQARLASQSNQSALRNKLNHTAPHTTSDLIELFKDTGKV